MFLENCLLPEEETKIGIIYHDLKSALLTEDWPEFINTLRRCLSAVSYQALSKRVSPFLDPGSHQSANSLETQPDHDKSKDSVPLPTEYVFQSIIQILFIGAGFKTILELQQFIGRPDLIIYPIRFGLLKTALVIELKIIDPNETDLEAAEKGMAQILSRSYADQYQIPVLVSLAINAQERKIKAGFYVKDGQKKEWFPEVSWPANSHNSTIISDRKKMTVKTNRGTRGDIYFLMQPNPKNSAYILNTINIIV